MQAPREDWVAALCNYDPRCLSPGFPVQCQAWYDRVVLVPNQPGRSGYSIVLQIRRGNLARSTAATAPEDAASHLQIAARTVPRTVMSLDSCMPGWRQAPHDVPLFLIGGAEIPELPENLVTPDPLNACAIEKDLQAMGFSRHVYLLDATGMLSNSVFLHLGSIHETLMIMCTFLFAYKIALTLWLAVQIMGFLRLNTWRSCIAGQGGSTSPHLGAVPK